MKKCISLFVGSLIVNAAFAENCPPADTVIVTPPQDQWSVPYWNDWEGIELITWNTEHFPKSGSSTINGVAEVMLDMMADIYAIQEVDDKSAFENQLTPLLSNYDYVISNESVNTNLAVLYRSDVLEVLGTDELWGGTPYWDDGDNDYENNALYYFAGRPPLRVDFLWECGEKTFEFSVINVHLKCCNNGLDRRRIAVKLLRDYLLNTMAIGDTHVVILGDWNDDLVDNPPDDAFTNFLKDTFNFYFVTLPLAEDPTDYYDSYPSWPSFLDHILITRALFRENEEGTATTFRLDDSISNYSSILSDHRPVGWKFPVHEIAPVPRIVINEIMQDPAIVSDADGEWFELYNADTAAFDLNGWIIKDNGSNSHTIGSSLIVQPSDFVVLGINDNTAVNGGVQLDYQYSNMFLGNGYDELILVAPDGTTIDSVAWDDGTTFPGRAGASMALRNPALDNDIGANWAESTVPYGDGNNLGTPGEANYDVSVDGETVFPKSFQLFQNYPNPFNASTEICYLIPYASYIRLTVYDILGSEIKDLVNTIEEPGLKSVLWDGRDDMGKSVTTGVYFYRIQARGFRKTQKMILLK